MVMFRYLHRSFLLQKRGGKAGIRGTFSVFHVSLTYVRWGLLGDLHPRPMQSQPGHINTLWLNFAI